MSNASKILEKKSANIHHMRRSTPDSEALASSDDDHDQNPMSQSAHSTHSTQSATFAKPARRASWLSEVQAGSQQRKFSVGSASNVQPGSGPTTPAGESGPSAWGVGSGMMRPSPWSGAWQKEPPARLMEDVPYEGYMGRYPLDDEPLVSPTSYQHPGDENDGSFPFPIPMQPVRKTFRSQSYSVGQMEAEANAAGAQAAANPPTMAAHPRSGVTGLPHRPSRPSMLGENSVGGGRPILGQLLEDEDDHDHPHSPVNYSAANLPRTNLGKSDQASNIPNASSALLKQAAVENARARQKTSSNIGLGGSVDSYARFRLSQPTYTNIPAQPAIDDMNEGLQILTLVPFLHRQIETLPVMLTLSYAEQDYGDGRRPEAKKALWQTSLGFGPVDEGSQSRRHSFADVPPRSRTISSSLLSPRSHEGLGPSASVQHDTAVVDDRKSTFRPRSNTHPLEIKPPMSASSSSVHPLARIVEEEPRNPLARVVEEEIEKQHDFDRAFAALYFHGVIPSLRAQQTAAETQASASYRDAPHPSMNPFAVPSVITNPQPDLYLVTFKCARAEVYYIPANTGLQVKMGDMVVVEGDRGIDLGTVSHARVSMAEAKALKEAATDQHFNWLMMFSRTMQAVTGTTPSTGLLANSNGDRPSAVGGMGPRVPLPSSGQSPHADHDIRPKMIRRLAQNHEIQMLRDKEGAEAKAKRVCQSKVSDHGLNMEILDAEFQL